MKRLFGSRFDDEDTQTPLGMETSALATRYQPQRAVDSTDGNYSSGNGNGNGNGNLAQHLFKTEREKLFAIVKQMRLAPDLETLFETTVVEVRKSMQADRVLIYRFESDSQGVVVAEARGREWTPALGEKLAATCFGLDEVSHYSAQKIVEFNNVHSGANRITPYQLQLLEHFQVKASLALPIFVEREVWGLLVVQQCSGSRHWEEVEINLLYQIVTELTVTVQSLEFRLKLRTQTEYTRTATQVAAKVMDKIRRSLDVDTVFRSTTHELLQLLKADRVAVYRFNPDWSGEFISESLAPGWVPLVGPGIKTVWEDSHMQDTQGGRYRHNETFAVDDVYKAGHSPCHVEVLEQFQIKAYAIAPIFFGGKLWGLLAAYQNSGPRHWKEVDVNCLAQVGAQFGVALKQAEYLQQVEAKAGELAQAAEQERAVAGIIDKIRKSQELDTIFRTTTKEVRKLLQADRVCIYRFDPDWSGEVVVESVTSGWIPLVNEKIASEVSDCNSVRSLGGEKSSRVEDTYLQQTQGGRYRQNRQGFWVNDIYTAGFSPCYIETLERFEAKAYVTTPIFIGEKLWGLLAVYQNSGPRDWQESEVRLLAQVAAQLGIGVQQAENLAQLQAQSQQLTSAAQREKAAKEQLQQRAIQLLAAVQPAFGGDLTVRAPVTEDEVGTIADAYNNTLQSLRKLVTQVKTAATNVAQTSGSSDQAITNLTTQAQYQFKELTDTLEQIQEMTNVTQVVTANAQQVEMAVLKANQTVQAGDAAMNRTVDGILGIRETVAETGKKIKRLSESSQKISRVVNLIGYFTSQTQLLALNASIEATRAGEYGRGFAVVADEVRSLARQSATATTEIEKLVQEIQTETIEVAAAMETGIQQVVAGTNLVNETRQSLNEIVASTGLISKLVEGITQATLAQTQQSQSVTQTMVDLAAVATHTSEGAVQISTSFKELLNMAQDLQASVGQFKVS